MQSLATELDKARREKNNLSKINEEMAQQREVDQKDAEKKVAELRAEYLIYFFSFFPTHTFNLTY